MPNVKNFIDSFKHNESIINEYQDFLLKEIEQFILNQKNVVFNQKTLNHSYAINIFDTPYFDIFISNIDYEYFYFQSSFNIGWYVVWPNLKDQFDKFENRKNISKSELKDLYANFNIPTINGSKLKINQKEYKLTNIIDYKKFGENENIQRCNELAQIAAYGPFKDYEPKK